MQIKKLSMDFLFLGFWVSLGVWAFFMNGLTWTWNGLTWTLIWDLVLE
ncbi:MAG: hypothetical protein KJ592_00620 [Nanoarchaeota archaeon]|nr:hypothetical protein [Nanoarchaeota archaeon]